MVTVPGYEIHRLLNWGSQGDVFLATDRTGRKVALKVVTPDRVEDEERAVERLRREARLLTAISSPHVVVVHEFLESTEWSCLVLEYLEGKRLEAVVRERAGTSAEPPRGPADSTIQLPADQLQAPPVTPRRVPQPLQTAEHVDWALGVAVQLATGVAELHAIGLIHRDLKPQNAMLVDGRVVLIDFGFARMAGMTALTQSGAAVGTLGFMSPEQFRGAVASTQSDVYGLGATICFCLLGSPPIDVAAPSIAALAKKKPPPKLRRHNPAIPPAFAAVLARALQPDPRDRYADARQLLADLERCRRGERVRLPLSPGRLWRQYRRVLAAVACVLLLGLSASLLWGGIDAERVAVSLRDAAVTDEARAMAEWQQCSDEEQLQVADALNELLRDDAERALAVARVLQLGLLRVSGRTAHYGALQPCSGDEAPRCPSAFVDLERSRSLLVRAGRAWFLVGSRNRAQWWSDTDPLILQFLLDVPSPNGAVPERSLVELPTEAHSGSRAAFVAFAPAAVQIMNAQARPVTEVFPDPMCAGRSEVDCGSVDSFRALLRDKVAVRPELDAWLRHPDEPEAAAVAFWQAVATSTRDETRASLPALVTFWEAHRFAAFHGSRLPSLREWQRVSRDGPGSLGTLEERVCEATPVAVGSEPRWDRTKAGICFANSNVPEWTLQRAAGPTKSGYMAVPIKIRMLEVLRWNPAPAMLRWPEAPYSPQGLRLYRTVVSPR